VSALMESKYPKQYIQRMKQRDPELGKGWVQIVYTLSAKISKATFGLTLSEYKDLKGLERENLRDHMNDLELIFSILGEAATTEITKTQDAQGFEENRTAAKKGGQIAGDARE
jgi:hypothetical protein